MEERQFMSGNRAWKVCFWFVFFNKISPSLIHFFETHTQIAMILTEVNIYVKAPPGVKAAKIVCNISPRKLELGIRGSDRYFISEATYSLVDTSESSWYMDDDIINIVLIKAHRAETWESALKTVAARVDAFQKQDIQKSLLLERFQQENPGFDFRDAEFNGSVPDPRTFMGGVNYK
jgi:hypothetical protein